VQLKLVHHVLIHLLCKHQIFCLLIDRRDTFSWCLTLTTIDTFFFFTVEWNEEIERKEIAENGEFLRVVKK
jgi:hypothetical protein